MIKLPEGLLTRPVTHEPPVTLKTSLSQNIWNLVAALNLELQGKHTIRLLSIAS